MKRLLKRTLLTAATLLIGTTTAFANVCKDDPRMFTIKTVLDKVEAGEAVEPMKLTPQTFLELTDNVRAALGDNIRVYNESCVPVQVFEGKIAKPILIPYPLLEDSLHRAALRGDDNMISLIFQQFRPEPVLPEEAVSYTRALTWSPDAIESLYRTGLAERVAVGTNNEHSTKYCATIEAPVSQLALFVNLGGRLKAPSDLIAGSKYADWFFMTPSGTAMAFYDKAYAKRLSENVDNCYPMSIPRIINSLTAAGFIMYEYEYTFRDKDDALRDYRKEKATGAL